jgi:hypothetical protein
VVVDDPVDRDAAAGPEPSAVSAPSAAPSPSAQP